MSEQDVNHRTIVGIAEPDFVDDWLEAFLVDRRIRGATKGSVEFYRLKLTVFRDWLDGQVIDRVTQITPNHIRQFLLWLEERGNNPGGRHAYFRCVRAFLNFFEDEVEPVGWRNPVKKVGSPKVPERPIEPVKTEEVERLLRACQKKTFHGERDRAIFMVLLDSGVRASELTALNLCDLDLVQSSLFVRSGKGRKPRHVFVGKKTRRQLRRWIRFRGRQDGPLFTKRDGERLEYGGLRQMLRRRSKEARVSGVTLHDFRRAFCLAQLQAGTPETTIARLMGHSNTQLIATYARQTTRDLREVFHSVADERL
jgi:site-specific recombinase XerD